MKLSKASILPALFGMLALHSPDAGAGQADTSIYMPNNHGKSITTPVAWGAYNNVIFVGAGGTAPSPYTTKNDGAAVLGVGLGNPKENIGVQASIISIDISEWKEYSSAFHVFRELGNADAVGSVSKTSCSLMAAMLAKAFMLFTAADYSMNPCSIKI